MRGYTLLMHSFTRAEKRDQTFVKNEYILLFVVLFFIISRVKSLQQYDDELTAGAVYIHASLFFQYFSFEPKIESMTFSFRWTSTRRVSTVYVNFV